MKWNWLKLNEMQSEVCSMEPMVLWHRDLVSMATSQGINCCKADMMTKFWFWVCCTFVPSLDSPQLGYILYCIQSYHKLMITSCHRRKKNVQHPGMLNLVKEKVLFPHWFTWPFQRVPQGFMRLFCYKLWLSLCLVWAWMAQ